MCDVLLRTTMDIQLVGKGGGDLLCHHQSALTKTGFLKVTKGN